MNVIIIGSRNFPDERLVRAYVHRLSILHQDDLEPIIIVSGGAPGVDSWAVHEAERLGLGFDVIRADWDDLSHSDAVIKISPKTGKQYDAMAGFRRNQKLADLAVHVVAFWDGESSGTRDMMARAFKQKKLRDLFIRYANNNS